MPPAILEQRPRRCVIVAVEHASEVDLASLPAPFGLDEPFVGVIWDAIGGSTEEERLAFGQKLLAAGCRYAVCGGRDGSAWDDAIDYAFVLLTLDVPEAERDARFIMTTWHEGEPVEEVVWFAIHCAHFDDLSFLRWLVVIRGGDEELRQRFERAITTEIKPLAAELE